MSNLQSWNRYSYVLNNPLSYTDPSGFFFSSIFKAIGNFFSSVFKAIGSVFKAILNVPIIRQVIQIIACSGTGPIGVAVCGLASGALTLLAGGSIMDALQSMAFSFANMGIWSSVGHVLGGVQETLGAAFGLVKSAVHGVVGGAMSLAQGGNFLEGFAANAVGAAAGLLSEKAFGAAGTGDAGDYAGRVATAAVAGGTASELTGGKFANGALTAAFAQMWNAEGGKNFSKKVEVIIFEGVGYGQSSFGHVAVNINGKVYSFTPDGMFTESLSDYMARNDFRDAMAIGLGLRSNEIDIIEQYLSNFNTPYSVFNCNCTTPIQSAFAKAGIRLPSAFTPGGLQTVLMRSSLYKYHVIYDNGVRARQLDYLHQRTLFDAR